VDFYHEINHLFFFNIPLLLNCNFHGYIFSINKPIGFYYQFW
jgi:hypothetical protein